MIVKYFFIYIVLDKDKLAMSSNHEKDNNFYYFSITWRKCHFWLCC